MIQNIHSNSVAKASFGKKPTPKSVAKTVIPDVEAFKTKIAFLSLHCNDCRDKVLGNATKPKHDLSKLYEALRKR